MATLAHSQQPPAAQNGTAHPFTCNTCQVAFRSSDLQRTHMQSDWHRYNLKRRVASLPPLTSEIFAEKVLANKASAAATAARASFEKRCDPCDKIYYSEGAYVNHLGSHKHNILAARLSARRGGVEGAETDSMADSTFTLGETLDTSSTTASTVNGDHTAEEEEVDEVVNGMKNAGLSESAAPVLSNGAPSNGQSAEQDDSGEYEHKANLEQCLFCNYISPTMALNEHHMSRQHSFFIPEKDYLVDLAGLINYLSETISVLHQCIFCHKSVHTATGVRTHMRDRGHCMIAYSTEEEQMEVGEFYDFRSTYSDDETEGEDHDEAAGGVSLGVKRAVKTTMENEDGEDVDMDEDEEGWESDSTVSSVPTDEIGSIPIDRPPKYEKLGFNRHHSHTDRRPHKSSDGFHSHSHQGSNAVYYDEYELHLPSGRTAGHRSLNKYYRQNLRNYPSAEERAQQQMIEEGRHDSDADDEDAQEPGQNDAPRGRQLVSRGNLGMVGVSDAKKREVATVQKRELKKQQRAEARYEWKLNKKANNQRWFRDPLLQ